MLNMIKNGLLTLCAITILIGTYASTAQARDFFYFDTLDDVLWDDSSNYPFCDPNNNCTYKEDSSNPDNNVQITITDSSIMGNPGGEITNSYSLEGEAEIKFSSSHPELIGSDDITDDNGDITFTAPEIEGTYRIYISAMSNDKLVEKKYFSINIMSFHCDSDNNGTILEASEGWVQDGDSNWLIGRTSGGDDSSEWASKQLLCMSNNQTTAVKTAKYKMTTSVSFENDPEDEDWNINNKPDSEDLADGTISSIEGWIPLNPTGGSFDGNNKTISNLYINRPTTNLQGFFGSVGQMIMMGPSLTGIYNLSLNNVDITGGSFVGGLVGNITHQDDWSFTDTDNVTTDGTITGNSYVGGIFGKVTIFGDVSIDNIHSSANVKSISGSGVGGISGGMEINDGPPITAYNSVLDFSNCSASGTITGNSGVGEINGTISLVVDKWYYRFDNNCTFTGTVVVNP
jgi:hypothetical protein